MCALLVSANNGRNCVCAKFEVQFSIHIGLSFCDPFHESISTIKISYPRREPISIQNRIKRPWNKSRNESSAGANDALTKTALHLGFGKVYKFMFQLSSEFPILEDSYCTTTYPESRP